ncbi:methyltransferase-like protein 6 isoform X1 [Chenopodium quinoa]|nr:methyltransferase-like protein 6 isoform X1 [Chenopodium quinoa]
MSKIEQATEMSKAAAANEYHSKDFEWEELKLEVETHPSLSYHLSPFQPSLSPSSQHPQAWSHFHSRHSTGKFFKERRYLLKEFPELLSCEDYSKVLEVGCGNGSTILPILRVKERTSVYACDCSVEALERAKQNLECSGIIHVMERFHPFCCDFSTTPFPNWLACDSCRNKQLEKLVHCDSEVNDNDRTLTDLPSVQNSRCCLGGVDFVTLIFTLSAIPPERMATAIMECFSVLKPGGLLFFRDYGLYDMTMLRFEPDKRVGFRHYMRSDGTLSYFFDLDGARNLFVGVGFNELELEYCCVKSVNRQKGKSMRRVWVHGKFQKPL